MIHEIVHAIYKELDNYLKLKFAISDQQDIVLLANIMNQDGSVSITEEEKIVLSIVNIAKDGSRGGTGGGRQGGNFPTNLSIYLLFSAYFPAEIDTKLNNAKYLKALNFLAAVVGYFQSKGAISPQNTPLLPDYVGTLNTELMDLSFDQLSNMWNSIGAKYIPSVLYRVRSISITDERIRGIDPDITEIDPGYNV